MGDTPLIGRISGEALEYSGKMRLGLKADAQRDIDQWLRGPEEQLLSAFGPFAKNAFMRPAARRGGETARQNTFG